MGRSSQILLDLEAKNSSTSSIESRLLLCKNDELLQSQTTKTNPHDVKPTISSVPKSQVLGKVKNFLGFMSEANKRLQLDVMDNSKDFDIEALTGNESEYIEMDLMLGVADLCTPEAIAAAESAIIGHQAVIPLAAGDSSDDDDNEDEKDDDNEDEKEDDDADKKGTWSPIKLKRTKPVGDESSGETLRNKKSRKRPNIVELP